MSISKSHSYSVVFLSGLIVASALALVYIRHTNRSLHIALQKIQMSRDELHVVWTQLKLEHGTLGSDVRVERIARDQLGMISPNPKEITVIQP